MIYVRLAEPNAPAFRELRAPSKAANLNVTLRIIRLRHFTTGGVAFWGRIA
jgi:hypothetical protein